MLNAQGARELAYLAQVTDITPIEKADRLELVHINGWTCVCGKGEFKKGEFGVFFEIDSKLPEKKPFSDMEFLVSKKYRIKSQKIRGALSQGLFMPMSAFVGTEFETAVYDAVPADEYNKYNPYHSPWLTEKLEVTYAVTEDNARKADPADKYKKMCQRHPNIFKQPWARWMMKRNWGKKVMFLFFGKRRDKKNSWPAEISKTDEERAQNQTWRFRDGNTEKWIVSEKIDGSSTTAFWKRKGRNKHEFLICSRNVVFDKPDKKCFYEINIYTEMAEKYNFEDALTKIADEYNLAWVALQGETYGNTVQKRDYSLSGRDFAGFNLIFSDRGRLNSYEARDIVARYGIPWVPLIRDDYVLPATVDEILEYAEGKSVIDGLPREGFVFRSQDGKDSFKAVSNAFLLKYHQ